MKRVLLIALAVCLLILASCQTGEPASQHTDPSTKVTAPVQSDPITYEPEDDDHVGNIGSVDGSFVVSDYYTYITAPNDKTVFVATGEEVDNADPEDGEVGYVIGSLYCTDEATGKTKLLSNDTVACFKAVKDVVFFVKQSAPGAVYTVDYNGENEKLVFTSELGSIRFIAYWGKDTEGTLYTITEDCYIEAYYISVGTVAVLVEGVELTSVMPAYEDGSACVYWQGAPDSESATGRYRFDFETGSSQLVSEG